MTEKLNNLSKAVITPEKRISSEEPEELKPALDFFWKNKPELYRSAFAMHHKVLDEKLNHRDFGVGASAVVFNSKTKEFKIINGWNTKETKDAEKHCAEKRVLEQAQSSGFDKIVGMVVVGEHQADPSQLSCSTLHPCPECRKMMSGSDLFWDDMPIITMSISPDTNFDELGEYSPLEEQHTLKKLLNKHNEATSKKNEEIFSQEHV